MSQNYFLAGLLDKETIAEGQKYQLEEKTFPGIHRTTKAQNLHITIGFIGPIGTPQEIQEVINLYDTLPDLPPIPLSFLGLELYGGSHAHKKYLGIKVEDSASKLQNLREETDQLLRKYTKYGYKNHHWQDFNPHITLQLLKKNLTSQVRNSIQDTFLSQNVTLYTFFIKKIALWRKNLETGFYESVWSRFLAS